VDYVVAHNIGLLDARTQAVYCIDRHTEDMRTCREMKMNSAYMPGTSDPSRLGTSTSVSMVRVAIWIESAYRVILPCSVRQGGHTYINRLAISHFSDNVYRHRKNKSQRIVLCDSYNGIACVCEAMPA